LPVFPYHKRGFALLTGGTLSHELVYEGAGMHVVVDDAIQSDRAFDLSVRIARDWYILVVVDYRLSEFRKNSTIVEAFLSAMLLPGSPAEVYAYQRGN
jgi:hypothetical protein